MNYQDRFPDTLVYICYTARGEVGEGLPLPQEKTGEDKKYWYSRTLTPTYKWGLEKIIYTPLFFQLLRTVQDKIYAHVTKKLASGGFLSKKVEDASSEFHLTPYYFTKEKVVDRDDLYVHYSIRTSIGDLPKAKSMDCCNWLDMFDWDR